MVQVGARHFTHQRYLTKGADISAFLGGPNRRHRQHAMRMRSIDKRCHTLLTHSRYRAWGREQHNIRPLGGEPDNILLADNAAAAFAHGIANRTQG